ncbi:MAG: GAF and HD-GYP domain-containing protein, partial [Planctomycetota bacterium]
MSGAADQPAAAPGPRPARAANCPAAEPGDRTARPAGRADGPPVPPDGGPGGRETETRAFDPAKTTELLGAIRRLSGELELDVLLARAMEVSTHLVEADRSSLFIYDRADDELWSKVAQGLDTRVLRFPASKGLAGSCARTGEVVNVPDAYEDERFNPEFDKKTGYRTRSVLCMPMKDARGHVLGVIQVLNRARGVPFDALDEAMLETLGSHVAVFIENAQLHEAIETLFESFVRAASTAIEERDPATSGHSRRVARYAVNLARAAHRAKITEFTRARLRQLRYASLLHDFGKIGVRESVLVKQNKLTDDRVELVAERLRRRELEREGDSKESDGLSGAIDFVRRANVPGFLSDEDVERLQGLAERGVLTAEEAERLTIRRGNLTAEEWKDMRSHADRSVHIL